MDELEFEEEAIPTITEDRVYYKASVSGFPVSVAASNEALAKLWQAQRGPFDVRLLDAFDPLHVDARAYIEQKYNHVGLDDNNAILLTADDLQ